MHVGIRKDIISVIFVFHFVSTKTVVTVDHFYFSTTISFFLKNNFNVLLIIRKNNPYTLLFSVLFMLNFNFYSFHLTLHIKLSYAELEM